MTLPSLAEKQNKSSSITPPPDGFKVRLIPDLSAAAFRQKKTNELCLWHCLRSLNFWGSGVIGLQMAKEVLENTFGYTPRQLARHLSQGNGSFWQIYPQNGSSTIKIYALKTICQYLDTLLEGNKYYRVLPAQCFTTLTERRSQLYASIHKPEGIKGNPISRQSIEEYTGLDRMQQRRYEIKAKVRRTPNYAMQKDQDGKLIPVKQEIFTKTDHYFVNKRLGNIYHSKQKASSPGMLRELSAELRGDRSSIPDGAQKPPMRRFFTSMRRIVKQILAHKGIREGYYIIPSKNRHIKGRLEWCLIWET